MKVHNWPKRGEHQYYVRDNQGIIWFVDSQFDTGVATAVTSAGSLSVALSGLRDLRGPLHILNALDTDFIREFPTIDVQPKLTEPKQEIIATTEAEARALS